MPKKKVSESFKIKSASSWAGETSGDSIKAYERLFGSRDNGQSAAWKKKSATSYAGETNMTPLETYSKLFGTNSPTSIRLGKSREKDMRERSKVTRKPRSITPKRRKLCR